jgi:hypothetical protein
MSVVVPINHNEIAQLIFECSEDIPNDFYIDIMNLMKKYYENGNNLNEIHVYLNKNKKRINGNLFKKIKKLLEPVKNKKIISCPSCEIEFNCCCTLHKCYNCITSLQCTILFILILIGIIVTMAVSGMKQ